MRIDIPYPHWRVEYNKDYKFNVAIFDDYNEMLAFAAEPRPIYGNKNRLLYIYSVLSEDNVEALSAISMEKMWREAYTLLRN